MAKISDYERKYENISFERKDNILLVTLHTSGGSLVFSDQVHHDLGFAFADLNDDPENKVVILAGAGDTFCSSLDYRSFLNHDGNVHDWAMRIRTDGRRMLSAFLDIDIPIIAAINGPALSHSELPLLADVVLASDTTVFQDATHLLMGVPPGDGMHTVWTTLLGLNRGRHFLMTGQRLTAEQALALGVVAEVLPRDELLQRAWKIAERWAALPRSTLVTTRNLLTIEWKRLLFQQLNAGLVEEGFSATASLTGGSPSLPSAGPEVGVVDFDGLEPI